MEEGNQVRKTRLLTLLSFSVISIILVADQLFKFWIKTNMRLGENIPVFGNWFILHFTENNGMAFGLELAGNWGKLFLTFFRLIAVAGILYYLIYQLRHGAKTLTILLISLIFAGAMGNIIDSVFYGKWFTESKLYGAVATWAEGEGYSNYFRGKVVDMLYFPILKSHYPSWVPGIGGKELIFFRPVFNLADAAISTGVFAILLFKRDLFQTPSTPDGSENVEHVEEIIASSQVTGDNIQKSDTQEEEE